jgi:hypothetical protein
MTGPIDVSQSLLTTIEAAAYVRLSARTLEGFRCEGCGPRYFKLGTGKRAKVVYRREDLVAWVESNARDPKT